MLGGHLKRVSGVARRALAMAWHTRLGRTRKRALPLVRFGSRRLILTGRSGFERLTATS